MDGFQSISLHLPWIVPLVLLIAFLYSPRFRGDIAETRVRRLLNAGLETSRYTIINDLVVPSGGGTIHIDHIVVSKFGVFVIESEYVRGRIAGGEFQDRWQQFHLRRTTRIENPMHRNFLQVQALEAILGLPSSRFHPIVVLAGQKGFKTPMPSNILSPERLIPYMRRKGDLLLNAEQAARVLKKIADARVDTSGGWRVDRWSLLKVSLVLFLLGGAYFAFRDEVAQLSSEMASRSERESSPEKFHPDGGPKTEQELWEESLICAWSDDTGRCACYEPGGERVNLGLEKCRALAERGSILKQ